MLTSEHQTSRGRPLAATKGRQKRRQSHVREISVHLHSSHTRQLRLVLTKANALASPNSAPEPAAINLLQHWSSAERPRYVASESSVQSRSLSAVLPVPVKEIAPKEEERPLRPLPREVENLADDPQLHNPLERAERLSTGWFGVVMEYDGVVVEDTSDLQRKAWLKIAEEEGKPLPPQFLLRRADGMKNDQVIKEVFCWTREPMEVRRIAERKELLLTEMLGDMQPMIVADIPAFMDGLSRNKIPTALATSTPEARVKPVLEALGSKHRFEAIVAAEDTYRGRPDPEPYLVAAQMIKRPPARCIVIGNSNQTVEAARECGMASVVVAGGKPLYELKAADLVVKNLSELRLVNLKQLFRNEDLVASNEPQPELEEEDSYEDTSLW